MKRIYVLLGGVAPAIPFLKIPDGADGWVTSRGLVTFANDLTTYTRTIVHTYVWGNWETCLNDMEAEYRRGIPEGDKMIVIGYSGGGSRATYIGYSLPAKYIIDLMVLWDPSPKWQMQYQLGPNVKKILQFHNTNPMMPSQYGMLGGGEVKIRSENHTTKVETVSIAEQHLLVQADKSIKAKTLTEIFALG